MTKDLLDVARAALTAADEETKARFHEAHMNEGPNKRPVPKADEIEEELRKHKAALDLTEEVSMDVRNEFNRRKSRVRLAFWRDVE